MARTGRPLTYTNPEDKHRARTKSYLNYSYKRLYGITIEDRDRMFEQQNGCCAICGTPEVDLSRMLVVDHDHTTNKVRALLCDACNVGLGRFLDSPDRLRKAADYLEKYNAPRI